LQLVMLIKAIPQSINNRNNLLNLIEQSY